MDLRFQSFGFHPFEGRFIHFISIFPPPGGKHRNDLQNHVFVLHHLELMDIHGIFPSHATHRFGGMFSDLEQTILFDVLILGRLLRAGVLDKHAKVARQYALLGCLVTSEAYIRSEGFIKSLRNSRTEEHWWYIILMFSCRESTAHAFDTHNHMLRFATLSVNFSKAMLRKHLLT